MGKGKVQLFVTKPVAESIRLWEAAHMEYTRKILHKVLDKCVDGCPGIVLRECSQCFLTELKDYYRLGSTISYLLCFSFLGGEY